MRIYYKVKEINGDQITVHDQYGNTILVSKNILEKMNSGNHFEKEVHLNKTSLAELLFTFSDTVFQICFHKQPNLDTGLSALNQTNPNSLKDNKQVNEIVKNLTQGELCTMVCHLINAENHLGRSTVIDLNVHWGNKFRQIDHRSIEWIIFKNVKYVLKKSEKKGDDE